MKVPFLFCLRLERNGEKMKQILNQNAVLECIEQTPYITFPAFESFDRLVCGFSTRLGGVSRGCFASMNLGFARGDSEENVMENYRRLCKNLGIVPERLVFTDQVHNTVVRQATAADCGKGMIYQRDYSGVDGHITNESNVPLLVFGADCVPVFLYDHAQHAIGAVHAGWKGTAGKIAAVAVKRMQEAFGSRAKDIIAVIGPSIGSECYEVGKEVADVFYQVFYNVEGIVQKKQKESSTEETNSAADLEKYMLDLWEANRYVLMEAGVLSENISVSGLCTMCRQDLFFSHRATNGRRGSMAGFIMLR